MSLDIFRLDWIFIDTIIIVLLFLLLFGVKLFKEMSRWRSNFSNEALKTIQLEDLKIDTDRSSIIVKKSRLIKNSVLSEEKALKVVVFIITERFLNRNLVRILMEGLSTYGFDIIAITLKVKSKTMKGNLKQNGEISTNVIISKVLNHAMKENINLNSNYVVIDYSKFPLLYTRTLSDKNNQGIISINPKVTNINVSRISNIINLEPKFHLIFSEKSHLILNNCSLKKFLKNNPHYNKLGVQLTIIDNCRNSFKYHETILLGMLLNLLEMKK